MGCVGEVCEYQENGGKSLNSIRDDISEEIGMKMSTSAGQFGERGGRFVDALSKHTGCFGNIQVNQKYGVDSFNSIRDETGEVGMKPSSRASQKREGDFVDKNRKQQIQRISPPKNNKHCENLETPISFINPKYWKSKKETDKKQETSFESISDQIKKRQKIVNGRKKCVSNII